MNMIALLMLRIELARNRYGQITAEALQARKDGRQKTVNLAAQEKIMADPNADPVDWAHANIAAGRLRVEIASLKTKLAEKRTRQAQWEVVIATDMKRLADIRGAAGSYTIEYDDLRAAVAYTVTEYSKEAAREILKRQGLARLDEIPADQYEKAMDAFTPHYLHPATAPRLST
jgi:hypothetical protein